MSGGLIEIGVMCVTVFILCLMVAVAHDFGVIHAQKRELNANQTLIKQVLHNSEKLNNTLDKMKMEIEHHLDKRIEL